LPEPIGQYSIDQGSQSENCRQTLSFTVFSYFFYKNWIWFTTWLPQTESLIQKQQQQLRFEIFFWMPRWNISRSMLSPTHNLL